MTLRTVFICAMVGGQICLGTADLIAGRYRTGLVGWLVGVANFLVFF